MKNATLAILFVFSILPFIKTVSGQYEPTPQNPPQKKIAEARTKLGILGPNSVGLAQTWLNFGLLHLGQRPDTALKYLQLALTRASKDESKDLLAEIHLSLGHIFTRFGAYSSALEHYLKALDGFQELQNLPGQANTHNALGNLYYFTLQKDDALARHEKALEISREEGLPRLEARTLGYLGHFYEKQGNYGKALGYQHLALEKYKEMNDIQGLSTIYGNLGSIYEDLQEYEKAYDFFSLALQYNLQTGNEEARIIHLNDLGDVFRKRGLLEEGLRYTSQALDLALKLESPYQEKSARRDLAKNYAMMGKFEKAYELMDKAYELHEDLFDGEEAKQIARMESLHAMNQSQRELDVLKSEQRIARVTFAALISGLLLLLLLLLLWVSRQRLKAKKNSELLETKQALITQELENSRLREEQLKLDLEARSSQLSSHALSIVQKNKILKDIKTRLTHLNTGKNAAKGPVEKLIKKIDENFQFDKDWTKFNQIFEQVHPSFYRDLNEKYPDMTASEIRLCALLRLNLDSKDIANILGISQDSLRVARYRLRKKMDLEKGSNLTGFIMNI